MTVPHPYILLLPAQLSYDVLLPLLQPSALDQPVHREDVEAFAASIQGMVTARIRFNASSGLVVLDGGPPFDVLDRIPLAFKGTDTRRFVELAEQIQALVHSLVVVKAPDGTLLSVKPVRELPGSLGQFQLQVEHWVQRCFGNKIAKDIPERRNRFTEEALELVQASGGTREDVLMLVDYVFSRPVGELASEAGGTMTTLASLCSAAGLRLDHAAHGELVKNFARIDAIRAKRALKPDNSPLP